MIQTDATLATTVTTPRADVILPSPTGASASTRPTSTDVHIPRVTPPPPQTPREAMARVYQITENGPVEYLLDPAVQRVAIGNGDLSDMHYIKIDEPEIAADQIVFFRMRSCWIVMDRGKRDALTVNGVSTRQYILRNAENALIGIDRTFFIFCGPRSPGLPRDAESIPRLLDRADGTPAAAFTVRYGKCCVVSGGRPILIGRSPACDLQLDNPNIAPLHAVVYPDITGVHVLPVHSNSVCLSGDKLTDRAKLREGRQTLNCGLGGYPRPTFMVQVCVTDDAFAVCLNSARQRSDYETFCLTPIANDGVDEVYLPMDCRPTWLGREPECDIRMEDTYVSHLHALLMPQRKFMTLEDACSTNGTFVNDREITAQATVKAGDVVQFGGTRFLLAYS